MIREAAFWRLLFVRYIGLKDLPMPKKTQLPMSCSSRGAKCCFKVFRRVVSQR